MKVISWFWDSFQYIGNIFTSVAFIISNEVAWLHLIKAVNKRQFSNTIWLVSLKFKSLHIRNSIIWNRFNNLQHICLLQICCISFEAHYTLDLILINTKPFVIWPISWLVGSSKQLHCKHCNRKFGRIQTLLRESVKFSNFGKILWLWNFA